MAFRKVLAATFYYLYQYRRPVCKALLLPCLGLIALDMAVPEEGGGLWGLLLMASLIIQVLVAVNLHRIVLLGPDSVPALGIGGWGHREWWYLARVFGLFFIVMPLLLLAVIPYIGPLLALGGIILVAGRLGLVFPALAIDRPLTFTASWHLTARHPGLMVLAVIVIPALLTALLTLIPHIPVISTVLSLLMVAIQIALLSMVYQLIMDESNQPPAD